jgi:hypothetical protein
LAASFGLSSGSLKVSSSAVGRLFSIGLFIAELVEARRYVRDLTRAARELEQSV